MATQSAGCRPVSVWARVFLGDREKAQFLPNAHRAVIVNKGFSTE
jgi:hypothetical protein